MAKSIKYQKILLACLLLGTSGVTLADNTNDPYERYNRAMFTFNDKADQYVMTPVARGYRKVTPKPVRSAVRNFFNNLRDVNSFGSNVLRGNVKNAGYDFMRVAVNTTFGIGGLIDVASEAGMPNNKNTLGDTFATWGWKNSNYLVLPLVGPTTVRDGLGNAVHTVYSPTGVINDRGTRYALIGTNAVSNRENLLDTTDALNEMAVEKYVATRTAYIAFRNQQLGLMQPESMDELIDPDADYESSVSPTEPTIAMPTQFEE
ncbi:MlaA family lipoprotein [Wielerella bovis]|uniref:MlaA family lipoprotein n=1 Tax=Wielerella bovis TaxID=2917790 RepID=UPI002019FDC9|nr:VacJ family lipoprotein [Wielerella bovis]MCG7656410.1 VacJ family lipoprotein [Wielerella bovis]MCG7658635.1 VacJ family lipoprotein [Wielerella bovis]